MGKLNNEISEEPKLSDAMKEEVWRRVENMDAEQKRRFVTESKLSKFPDEMNQLVDRIASNSFQG